MRFNKKKRERLTFAESLTFISRSFNSPPEMKVFQGTQPSPSWSRWTKTWENWCCSSWAGRHQICGRTCGTGCRLCFLGPARRTNRSWLWEKSASKQERRSRGTALQHSVSLLVSSNVWLISVEIHTHTFPSARNYFFVKKMLKVETYLLWTKLCNFREHKILAGSQFFSSEQHSGQPVQHMDFLYPSLSFSLPLK